MIETNPVKQKPFNPWHFIWIAIVFSELFTALISTIQHHFSPEKDLMEMLEVGAIDALFVPLIIAPVIIYFTRNASVLRKINAQLEHEIVERKRTEEMLRLNEERLRLAMVATKEGWYDLNIQTGEIKVSEEYPEILGYEPTEFRSNMREWTNGLHPEDRDTVLRVFKEAIATGDARSMEYRQRMKAGAWKWIRSTGKVIEFDANKKPLRMIGIHADISEQKRTEEALLESKRAVEISKARFEQVVSMISDIVWHYEVDTQARYISSYISPVADRILGLTDGTIGNSFEKYFTYVHPADLPAVQITLRQVIQNHSKGATVEYRLCKADGSIRWARSKGSAYGQSDGSIIVVGTTNDITEIKEAEKALRASNDRLEVDVAERTAALTTANERLRSLSVHLQEVREQERTRIAREIHDELGQSLTAIRMELSLLRKGLSEDQREAARKAESMDQLIESTMHAVKRISLELRPGILDHLGLTAAMEWQAEEFERRSGISCTVFFDPPAINLDDDRATTVFRIFQETLTNTARHAEASLIDARLSMDNNILTLEVRDNGLGIKDSQINNRHSFGLVGIQERIQVWGGSLLITSKPGEGTTITVQIPVEMKGAAL